jgi:outer membrane protein assembly factor BamE (lipoprotein component of BamABCDE complex)
MKRKISILILAAALAVPISGSSCEDTEKDLQDVAGENDAQYRANIKKVKLGMTADEVRDIMGEPRDKQTTRSAYGNSSFWYFGTYQLGFDDGKLTSKNRF